MFRRGSGKDVVDEAHFQNHVRATSDLSNAHARFIPRFCLPGESILVDECLSKELNGGGGLRRMVLRRIRS